MTAHDNWLANYRHYGTDAYCHNERCHVYGQRQNVDYEEEYGQGSIRPEECADCGADLSLEPPTTRQEDS